MYDALYINISYVGILIVWEGWQYVFKSALSPLKCLRLEPVCDIYIYILLCIPLA